MVMKIKRASCQLSGKLSSRPQFRASMVTENSLTMRHRTHANCNCQAQVQVQVPGQVQVRSQVRSNRSKD